MFILRNLNLNLSCILCIHFCANTEVCCNPLFEMVIDIRKLCVLGKHIPAFGAQIDNTILVSAYVRLFEKH